MGAGAGVLSLPGAGKGASHPPRAAGAGGAGVAALLAAAAALGAAALAVGHVQAHRASTCALLRGFLPGAASGDGLEGLWEASGCTGPPPGSRQPQPPSQVLPFWVFWEGDDGLFHGQGPAPGGEPGLSSLSGPTAASVIDPVLESRPGLGGGRGSHRIYLRAPFEWQPTGNQIPGNVTVEGSDWERVIIKARDPDRERVTLGGYSSLLNVALFDARGAELARRGRTPGGQLPYNFPRPVRAYHNDRRDAIQPAHYPYMGVSIQAGAESFDLDRPGLAVNQFGIGDAIWVFNAHGDAIRAANERADASRIEGKSRFLDLVTQDKVTGAEVRVFQLGGQGRLLPGRGVLPWDNQFFWAFQDEFLYANDAQLKNVWTVEGLVQPLREAPHGVVSLESAGYTPGNVSSLSWGGLGALQVPYEPSLEVCITPRVSQESTAEFTAGLQEWGGLNNGFIRFRLSEGVLVAEVSNGTHSESRTASRTPRPSSPSILRLKTNDGRLQFTVDGLPAAEFEPGAAPLPGRPLQPVLALSSAPGSADSVDVDYVSLRQNRKTSPY